MATIKSTIRITDGMTPALRSMTKSMNIVLSSFESLQRVSSNAVDTKSIQAARAELNKAETSFSRVEDEIERAKKQQENFNNKIDDANVKASGLGRTIKRLVTSAFFAMGAKKLTEQVDQYGGIQARLKLINDGQQTVDELNTKIMNSARRARGVYTDMADIIGKLGITASQAFSSNDEMIAFTEIMTKSFKIAGASAQEQSAAMYQLTQAMASGRLQGDEFRSILENAPMLAQAIAKEMDVTLGQLKELSSEGKITANVIKNAMFNSADEINEQFENMPILFSDVATRIQTEVQSRLQPTFEKIMTYLNSDEGQEAIEAIIGGILAITSAAVTAMTLIGNLGGFITENWDFVAPIIGGVAAVMGLLKVATIAATIAQWSMNAALYASPVVWVIAIIIGLITVIYLAIAAMNRFGGESISATGVIIGAFSTLLAVVANILGAVTKLIFGVIEFYYNIFAAFGNFIANFLTDPLGSMVKLFGSSMDNIYELLQKVGEAIDLIFGTNTAEYMENFRKRYKSDMENIFEKVTTGNYDEKFGKVDLEQLMADMGLDISQRMDYGETWRSGYQTGENLETSLKNVFEAPDMTIPEMPEMPTIPMDPLIETADNTAAIRDSVELTNEDLKYMRDLAEREFINRFTTAEVSVTVPATFGDVRETADVDGLISHIAEGLEETMAMTAEGANFDV